ncbi:hypothetical protein ACFRK5_08760 [Streptomyces niveus]|uniref:hypothetical protein n=1 Tax=Streptomyces niveus TaxID=193462 RepID=UPI003686F4F6
MYEVTEQKARSASLASRRHLLHRHLPGVGMARDLGRCLTPGSTPVRADAHWEIPGDPKIVPWVGRRKVSEIPDFRATGRTIDTLFAIDIVVNPEGRVSRYYMFEDSLDVASAMGARPDLT